MLNKEMTGKTVQILAPFGGKLHQLKVLEVIDKNTLYGIRIDTEEQTIYSFSDGMKAEVISQ